MKRIHLIILAILLCFSAALFACGEEKKPVEIQKTKLTTPANLGIDQSAMLTWDEVGNASGYIVSIDEKEYTVFETSYDLSEYVQTKNYIIKVMAIGKGDFLDSDWSDTIEHSVVARLSTPSGVAVHELTLSWLNVLNAGYYVVNIDGTEYTTTQNQFMLKDFTEIKTNYIKVKAVSSSSSYLDSDWSNTVEYRFEVTSGLLFTLLEDNSGYAVSKGLSSTPYIVLPSEHEGLPVKEILHSGFHNSSFTYILIPDSITVFGDYAFSNCYNMLEITIPDSVKTIGEFAFMSCAKLTKITIGSGVSFISDGFAVDSPSLVEIVVDENNAYFSSRDGVFYNKNQTKLITYPLALQGDFTVPSTVTTIGTRAFFSAKGLTAINLPNGLKTIEIAAFTECDKITEVIIPDSVTFIGENAFAACFELKKVVLGSGVTAVPLFGFVNCYKLETFIIRGNIVRLDQATIQNCTSLKNLVLPNSLQIIDYEVFYGCTALTSVVVSKNVTQFYPATQGATSLTLYCEASQPPATWKEGYNAGERPMIWDCTLSSDGKYVVSFLKGDNIYNPYSFTISAPYREGYTFMGWSTTAGGTVEYSATNISSAPNGTLYAIWQAA